jgi:hypothetical protein
VREKAKAARAGKPATPKQGGQDREKHEYSKTGDCEVSVKTHLYATEGGALVGHPKHQNPGSGSAKRYNPGQVGGHDDY